MCARCCENKFSINTKPENIEINNNTEPAEAILKSIFSVVSSGAKSELKEDIFFFLNLVSWTKAKREIIATAQSNPYENNENKTWV